MTQGVTDLNLSLLDVNDSKEPVHILLINGNNQHVQGENVKISGPPFDIFIAVASLLRQLGEEIRAGNIALRFTC